MVKSGTESLVGKNCLEFLLGALGELFLKFQEVFTAKAKPLAVRRELTKELEISLKSIKGAQKRVKGSLGEERIINVLGASILAVKKNRSKGLSPLIFV